MNQKDEARLHKVLDELNVPREVWIGTDSVWDRLEWLKLRIRMLEKDSKRARQSSGEDG